ncbi:MAG: DUF4326 domain-containing protein [Burkholderiaceae bacterium]|nr:DUF4326 domain-containing protein [Burkholderiaceae bacterium]
MRLVRPRDDLRHPQHVDFHGPDAAGWKAPANAVYVGRGSRWGNPFTADDPAVAVDLFRAWLDGEHIALPDGARYIGDHSESRRARLLNELGQLRRRPLMCWCATDRPCHADVLCARANRRPEAPARDV